MVAQQEPEANVPPGHQREWGEEVLAELAVGDPRRAGLGSLKGQRVDEDRAAAAELDVVGGRVSKGEAALAAATCASSVASAASFSIPNDHS